jgi:phosphatidylglycerophosphate synthase
MSDGDGYAPTRGAAGINCYSDGEGGFMAWSQSLRSRWLAPMLAWMAGIGLRASHITLLSLLAGLAFCPVLLWGHPVAAFSLLLLHVLLDGLDGPLARFSGNASNRGSFTDTMADQLVVTAAAITMIHAGYAGTWPGGLYLFFYTIVVVFAFVRSALAAPYSWLFRPRFLVFIWYVVEMYWLPGTLDWVLWACSGLLALKCLTGFIRIRSRI